MLTSLQIKNLALVKQAKLEFGSGLNIISGETGAGKSILINALLLVLGGRFSKSLQGNFADQTVISAIFLLDQAHPLIKNLKNLGYLDTSVENSNSSEQNQEIHIRRVINQNQLSHHYLNGEKISNKEIAEFAAQLIDIHSQHSQQSLMHTSLQRELLDQYAQIDLSALRLIYEQIKAVDEKLTELNQKQINQEKKQLIGFYLTELDEASLNEQELETIESDYKQASQVEKIKSNLAKAESIINGSESGISEQLTMLNKLIAEMVKTNPDFRENQEIANQIAIEISTIEENLSEYFQKLESSKSFEELEPRLNQLDQLARKHQCKIEELLQVKENLEAELNNFENDQDLVDQLKAEKNHLISQYHADAKEISQIRKQKAIELAKKIESKLKALAMKQGQLRIEVVLDEQKISANGMDEVEFKVSLNKLNPSEEDFLSLKKVASGGELSRISLAIETELADLVNLNCLVFDEVDSGIGGEVANQVGKNLSELSKNHQVICITHLAQIAAFADHHLVVEKELTESEKSKQNTILIKALIDQDQRAMEIARMISGDLHAQTSLIHATKMVEIAKKLQKPI